MEKILELKDVDFTYDGYKYVLKNINLTFEKEKVELVKQLYFL